MALGVSLTGAALLAVLLVLVLAWPRRYRGEKRSVQVLVLGDIGRSPRMQYHALSIAQHAPVQLIGYYESDLVDELARHPRLTRVPLTASPAALRQLPFVLGGPLKVVWQVLNLLLVLAYSTQPARWLVVQNPPSIPTLAVAALVGRLRNTRLLIDWHNYGWTILAGSRAGGGSSAERHPFVRLARRYEELCGRLGDANLTVTRAMASQLRAPPYAVPSPIAVLHDRPAALFQPLPLLPISPIDRGRELARILGDDDLVDHNSAKVLVSSTSWTPDEDFQLLLDALVRYVSTTSTDARSPILAIITGKGPQKAFYQGKIAALVAAGQLPPDQISICTAFLPMSDYARLLALADLGVCLHMSSSGVDLPMKVVDMFGAGLPVVAYSAYESFGELVREGENGRGFTTSDGLADLLARLLDPRNGSSGSAELGQLRMGARQESKLRWTEEWERVVAPVLELTAEGDVPKKTK
ncbi:beta-mannosyltransferase [Grosmannia clavigera kw1407]|uniref:Chitobiosyldiphosphodolichol beta-mannosyltransferase n=1 Tax=Grosmannia clavigera (strain kw1407 / UAMH 11150) TaxID=655863 RepID=F0X865_GROCL|nr:beta-mannosyltransferase [Grosmannia clavigera kw1407]EFX05309.1 beta-mannosyltransferase [Grosmannia clavigera kw1407]